MGSLNFKIIYRFLGLTAVLNGIFMFIAIPFSMYHKEEAQMGILNAGIITVFLGLLLYFFNKPTTTNIHKKEGYLIVTLGWLTLSFTGMLPYLFTGAIPNITDAFFETLSGYSTTGSSILTDIESMQKGILFWRSATHWIGGMGIIVLTIAILPLLGVGGMELFASEAPGPTKDKIHPRIKETAKRLWLIYVILTLTQALCLWLADMPLFDAINHALTTISTGGFSTRDASIGAFTSPLVQYIIIVFMFLGGTSFTLLYFGARFKFKKFLDNDEFKWYVGAILLLLLVIVPIVNQATNGDLENNFRFALFQIVSIITGTGYSTYDFTTWGAFATFIFFLLMFSGASAGSTSGGIKIVRIILLMKNTFLEFKRRLHPNAIIPVYLNKSAVSPKIIYNLLAFIFFYLFTFVIGAIILTFIGLDFQDAVSASITAVSNVGPGIGSVGPSASFAHLPVAAKWVLSCLMILGRLELFTIAILFTPYFWRRN